MRDVTAFVSLLWNGLPLELHWFSRATLTFYAHLKTMMELEALL